MDLLAGKLSELKSHLSWNPTVGLFVVLKPWTNNAHRRIESEPGWTAVQLVSTSVWFDWAKAARQRAGEPPKQHGSVWVYVFKCSRYRHRWYKFKAQMSEWGRANHISATFRLSLLQLPHNVPFGTLKIRQDVIESWAFFFPPSQLLLIYRTEDYQKNFSILSPQVQHRVWQTSLRHAIKQHLLIYVPER